ncbi:MAG TPA: glycosyltransferase family 39 protein [Magnetospirillaceae bacterium]|nr:glycosyltransferase family 39 protein [Magnetospirillaceae bacterium]
MAKHPGLILGVMALIVHLWVNAGYDYFVDELNFIVCGQHLAWGYIDHPPLVPLIARAARALFGDSLLGLRLVPALAAAGLAALTSEAARRLGGGLYARWLAGIAVLAAPVLSADGLLLSADTLQPLAWLATSMILISWAEAGNRDIRPTGWIGLGALVGLALMTKYVMAFFLVAAATGIVLTPARRMLARKAPWLAAGLALLIVLPNLLWQQAHGWPFLQLNAAAYNGRNLSMGPLSYLIDQILIIGPLTAPLWIAGLAGFAASPRLAGGRWLAIAWAVLMGLMLLLHGKSYYPAAIYPILLAGGAVTIETALRARAARTAVMAATAFGGVALAPFTLPILPIDRFLDYQGAVAGVAGLASEQVAVDKQPTGELPPNYANMFGWREMAAAVGRAYQDLPADLRDHAVFFARNYAEAAAIDVYGGAWNLPQAISTNDNYYLWGPRGYDGKVVLLLSTAPTPDLREAYAALGDDARIGDVEQVRQDLLKIYGTAEPIAYIDTDHAYPYERHLTLWLCRDRRTSLVGDWDALRLYF